jgi:hypothetical protein
VETKQEIISQICNLLRIQVFSVSNGSSESREFLLRVADQIGLGPLVSDLDKPGIAKLIVESFGGTWLPSFESRGSTITKEGLKELERVISKIADLHQGS